MQAMTGIPQPGFRRGMSTADRWRLLLRYGVAAIALGSLASLSMGAENTAQAGTVPGQTPIVDDRPVGADTRCSFSPDLDDEHCYSGSEIDISVKLAELQQRIADNQSARGQYDLSLLELYSEVAALHFESRDYEKALDYLDRALEVARANDGLYGESQIPVIERMTQAYVTLRDWRQANALWSLKLNILSTVHGSGSLNYLMGEIEFSRWQIREGELRSFTPTYAFIDLDRQLEAARTRLEKDGRLVDRENVGMLFERAQAQLFVIKDYRDTPQRQGFNPAEYVPIIGLSTKRDELRSRVDALLTTLQQIDSISEGSTQIKASERVIIEDRLVEMHNEIEQFKIRNQQIFEEVTALFETRVQEILTAQVLIEGNNG